MESSSLRLAISWAHPQGNTDSLWGKLKVCETMKKKRHKHKNKHNQTDTNYPTHKQRQTHKTHVSTFPPSSRRHTLSLTQVGSVSMHNDKSKTHFQDFFLLLSHPNEKKNEIHKFSAARRSGREQLSRLEDFVSDGGTLASSLFSGSPTMRSINLNLRNWDINRSKILRASLTFKCSPICFIMGWVAVGHIFL